MDLWDRFRQLNPLWDQFRFMGIFKRALYSFLPYAEKLAPIPDLKNPTIAYLNSIMEELRQNCKELNRDNDQVLRPIQKIGLGIASGDPAYLNYAVALIGFIRARDPGFTNKQKAWLKARFGVDLP